MKKNLLAFASAVSCLAVLGALYINTLFPGPGGRINFGDSTKWQLLWWVDGTPHPTGYPLFLGLTHLFGSQLNFLPATTRITLISTSCALLALAALFALLYKLCGRIGWALFGTLVFGTARSFWSQATEPEVYTLNAFWVAIVALFAVDFAQTRRPRSLFICILLFGLSLSHHVTMVWLAPAIFYLIIKIDPTQFKQPKLYLISVLALLAGVLPYYYIYYLSHHAGVLESYNFADTQKNEWLAQGGHLEFIGKDVSWERFFAYVSGGNFKGATFSQWPDEGIANLLQNLVANDVGPVFFLAAMLIAGRQLLYPAKKDTTQIFLICILLIQALFAVTYRIDDILPYYIPITLCFIVLGIYLFSQRAQPRLLTALLVLFLLTNGIKNYRWLKEEVNLKDLETRETLAPLNETDPVYFERTDFFNYHGFELLNLYRFCQACEFKRFAIADFSRIDLQQPFFALNPSTEFISQYHAHFHLQPVDLTPDWQALLNNPALILLFADAEATADEIPTSLRPYLQAHQSTLLQAKTPHAWVAALSQDHFNEQLVTGDSATLSNKELDRLGISKRALIKANAAIGQKKTTLRFGWKYLPAATDSLHLVVFDRAEQRVTGLYRFRHGEISFPRNRLIKLSPQPD